MSEEYTEERIREEIENMKRFRLGFTDAFLKIAALAQETMIKYDEHNLRRILTICRSVIAPHLDEAIKEKEKESSRIILP